jgi:hypothetical protein
VRNDGACSPSFLSCPSVENKIPACLAGYEPTTCHCLSKQWSCEVYGISCPDAGVRDVAADAPGDRPDASDDRSDAPDTAPGDEGAGSTPDSSDDAGD